MKEISIEIPESQVPFIMELLQKFNFVKINHAPVDKEIKLDKKQLKSVEAERAKSKQNAGYLMDWDKVKNTLKTD